MTTIPAGELSELAKHVLAFEHDRARHDRARHDRTKEAEIRVEFDMSPTRYYQVLNRVIDSPAALAYDPQLVGRLQRLRRSRTSARAARSFVAPGSDVRGVLSDARGVGSDARGVVPDARGVGSDAHRTEEER